ncbi:MAG TPA: hypothetical protein VMT88_03455 [Actinomycetes bacterium]|nr:hypothetical protein [Actinomycetes bacterium]
MTQALVADGRAHSVAKPQTLRGRGIQDRQAGATSTDHVIYRYDPLGTPCLTYHSIPGGLTGGAKTLAEARECYRHNVTELERNQRQGVPPAVEHLETALAGMWVRAKVAAAHRDPSTDQMFLLTLLSAGSAQDALRASLAHAASLGFNPVVVVVDPDETVSAVLDQTRTDDTLFVVHSDAENTLCWIAIHGPDAAGPRRAPLLMDRDRLRAMLIKDLTQAYSVGPQELRLQSSQLRDVRRQLVRLKGEACV